MAQFGLGIAIYFKFVKIMVWFFFICSLFSIPSLVYSFCSAHTSGLYDNKLDSQNFFMGSTIGSIDIGKYYYTINQYFWFLYYLNFKTIDTHVCG